MGKLFLVRYDCDAECDPENVGRMAGFCEKMLAVHRKHAIPVTCFCLGKTLETRTRDFADLWRETKDDPLFDFQDHSYSHIGVGYERGKPVEALRADYEKSFAWHERVFGKRPVGTSICGTGGVDGDRLKGFNQTEKARAEFEMLVSLGVKMTCAFLTGVDESREFASFARIGHPEVMGFPSGLSDTAWMMRRECGDPLTFILGKLRERASLNEHFALMLHDFVAWNHSPDRALTHVVRVADEARRLGYTLVTHAACYDNKPMWQTR